MPILIFKKGPATSVCMDQWCWLLYKYLHNNLSFFTADVPIGCSFRTLHVVQDEKMVCLLKKKKLAKWNLLMTRGAKQWDIQGQGGLALKVFSLVADWESLALFYIYEDHISGGDILICRNLSVMVDSLTWSDYWSDAGTKSSNLPRSNIKKKGPKMDQWHYQGLSPRGTFRLTGNSSNEECIEQAPFHLLSTTRVFLFIVRLLKTIEYERGGKESF